MGLSAFIRKNISWANKLHWVVGSLPDGAKVLDVGCGQHGSLRRIAGKERLEIHGIDMIDPEGKESFSTFHKIDLATEPFPFDENCFDFVVIHHVLEHLLDPHRVMFEILRVLKPGGRVYMESPSTRSLLMPSIKDTAKDDSPMNFYDDPTHLRPYNRCSFSRLSRQSGFSVLKTGLYPDLSRLLTSPLDILQGILTLNRGKFARGLRVISGWAVYCVAVKESKP